MVGPNLQESRHRLRALIVCKKAAIGTQLRQAFLGVGFNDVKSSSDYKVAVNIISDEKPDLVLFDAETPEASEILAPTFVDLALKCHPSLALIAVSLEPAGEYLSGLLQRGVRAFLIPPFTSGAIEDVFVQLQSGLELSAQILMGEGRQLAFSQVISQELDRTAGLLKDCKSRTDEFENLIEPLRESIKLSPFFCDDEQMLFKTAYEHFIAHADKLDTAWQQTRLRSNREMLCENPVRK